MCTQYTSPYTQSVASTHTNTYTHNKVTNLDSKVVSYNEHQLLYKFCLYASVFSGIDADQPMDFGRGR